MSRAWPRGVRRGMPEALAQAREKFAKDQAALITTLAGTLEAFNAQREKAVSGGPARRGRAGRGRRPPDRGPAAGTE